MRFLKRFGALGAALLAAACSTLSDDKTSHPSSVEPMAEMTLRAALLEAEVEGLREENTHLADRVKELERENEALEIAGKAKDSAESESAPVNIAELRDTQAMEAPKPEPAKDSEIDAPPVLNGRDVPVESSPRLVQPTFTATNAVFENEAANGVQTESVLYGVHLASYQHGQVDDAREGWRQLQRENPDELGLLEPRIATVEIEGQGVMLRLIAGGFSTKEKAAALCAALDPKVDYCSVMNFAGDRLSLAEVGR